jgi:hypothetical protein
LTIIRNSGWRRRRFVGERQREVTQTIPFLLALNETSDLGLDTRTLAEDRHYEVPKVIQGALARAKDRANPGA